MPGKCLDEPFTSMAKPHRPLGAGPFKDTKTVAAPLFMCFRACCTYGIFAYNEKHTLPLALTQVCILWLYIRRVIVVAMCEQRIDKEDHKACFVRYNKFY